MGLTRTQFLWLSQGKLVQFSASVSSSVKWEQSLPHRLTVEDGMNLVHKMLSTVLGAR